MGCFCAVPEEFYCEVLLLDESKLTLTTQQQGIKVAGILDNSAASLVKGSGSLLLPSRAGRLRNQIQAGQCPFLVLSSQQLIRTALAPGISLCDSAFT
ncbi:Band 4.1-like protein 4A [Myotis brandtii]|uniref:Band 4.1-like protein 4A n=1 Tax=Myotis brandtii TaxID=109478 RepID=S7PIW8_MYOBR|nr:Band 4.1-like protein 4A [Myotis brandtii]